MADDAQLLDEQQFQAVLDTAPDALVMVDGDGRIVRLNRQTEILFGYTTSELFHQPVENLLPTRFRTRHQAHRAGFSAQPRTRAMGEGLELFGLRKDGEEFPIDISLGPVHTSQGLLVMAAVRDATERRRAEAIARLVAEDALRRRQALELNDGVLQGLTAAALALDLGEVDVARAVLDTTLGSARRLVNQLIGEVSDAPRLQAGDLVRTDPALPRRHHPTG